MYNQWTVAVMLLLSSATSVYSLECPKGQGCTPCRFLSPLHFLIHCGTNEEEYLSRPHFQVEYKSEDDGSYEFLKINCVGSPKWSDFHLGKLHKMQAVSNISLTGCNLPSNIQLISVLRQLFDDAGTETKKSDVAGQPADDINQLIFNSHGNLRSKHGARSFKGVNNSIAMNLSHNGLQTVPNDLLHVVHGLETLNLGLNDLHGISGHFINSPSLRTLVLGKNNISSIGRTTFVGVPGLEVLDLSENQITKIHSDSFNALKKLRTLNLRGNNLMSLPPNIFSTLTELINLYLSNNNFSNNSLAILNFEGNGKLEKFELSYNKRNLRTFPETFLPPIIKLTTLKLDGNGITNIPSKLLKVTKEISLSNNQITDLSLRDIPDNLTALYLHGNYLTRLDKEDIQFLANSTKLESLTLHKNPWECGSNSVDFFDFIRAKKSKYNELEKVRCKSGASQMQVNNSADISTAKIPKTKCLIYMPWIITCAVFSVLTVIATLMAVYYRFRLEIIVWLYSRRLWPWLDNETDMGEHKVYDAFVSFSHLDDDFVMNTLVPKLEAKPHRFKLCVHYRDWKMGGDIAEQIVKSVDESRRTIIVLSRSFLKSNWGMMELRTAQYAALKDGRIRVIIIIYGEIGPIDELGPEVASYIRTNTYICWGDSLFWEKICYALPHYKINP